VIRELKLGGVNHHKMRKQVKIVYMPTGTCHRKTFPPQEVADSTSKI
jgi:hypothetical protein